MSDEHKTDELADAKWEALKDVVPEDAEVAAVDSVWKEDEAELAVDQAVVDPDSDSDGTDVVLDESADEPAAEVAAFHPLDAHSEALDKLVSLYGTGGDTPDEKLARLCEHHGLPCEYASVQTLKELAGV